MSKIQIGDTQLELEQADAGWITQQITRRRKEGEDVCIRVFLDETGCKVSLSTPTCQGGLGGGRSPNEKEAAILALWNKYHLNTADFGPGELVAFLKALKRLL